MRIVYLLVAVASLIAPQQAVAPQDPEAAARQAAARQALARPVTAGSVPFLIPHGRYANVAARIADALRDDRVDVRAVAARSIFVLAGKIYAALVAEALAVERDATAGAEMVRALLAIRGEAAEPEAIAAATRLGPAALNAISVTLAHTRPLDVLKWLTELARDEAGLADALLRAIAVDADAVARAVQSAPADADLDAIDAMFGRAVSLDLVIPPAVVDVSLRRGGRLQISALWYLVARGDAVRASGALAELGSAPGAGEVAVGLISCSNSYAGPIRRSLVATSSTSGPDWIRRSRRRGSGSLQPSSGSRKKR